MSVARDHLGHADDTTPLRFYEKPYSGGEWRQGMGVVEQIEAARTFVDSASVRVAIAGAVNATRMARKQRAKDLREKHRAAGRRSYTRSRLAESG